MPSFPELGERAEHYPTPALLQALSPDSRVSPCSFSFGSYRTENKMITGVARGFVLNRAYKLDFSEPGVGAGVSGDGHSSQGALSLPIRGR